MVMNYIFRGQIADAKRNIRKVVKGEKPLLIDTQKWTVETANLVDPFRFAPFKRGGDKGMAQLLKVRKQFDMTEWIESPEVLAALQEENFLFARNITDKTANDLQTALSEGVAAGESIPQIERRIVAVQEAWRDRRRSLMVARTETARAFTDGQIQAWKHTGVVEQKEWSAAGDACPFCLAMNGKIISLENSYFNEGDSMSVASPSTDGNLTLNFGYGSVEGPPLHPNCRCAIVAHIEI